MFSATNFPSSTIQQNLTDFTCNIFMFLLFKILFNSFFFFISWPRGYFEVCYLVRKFLGDFLLIFVLFAYNLTLFWAERIHRMTSLFEFKACSATHYVSLDTCPLYTWKEWVIAILGGVFYKCHLGQVGWLWYSNLLHLYCFSTIYIYYWQRSIDFYNHICGFVSLFLQICQFLPHGFWSSVIGCINI